MQQYSVHAAKTHLSKLIKAVQAGEEVVITHGKTPVARLVPYEKRTFKFGLLEGKVPPPPDDFFAPLSEDELADWEGR